MKLSDSPTNGSPQSVQVSSSKVDHRPAEILGALWGAVQQLYKNVQHSSGELTRLNRTQASAAGQSAGRKCGPILTHISFGQKKQLKVEPNFRLGNRLGESPVYSPPPLAIAILLR